MATSRDTASLPSRTTHANDIEREARPHGLGLRSYPQGLRHLTILKRRAAERNVSKAAYKFAQAKARGPCRDLLVVLFEALEYFE